MSSLNRQPSDYLVFALDVPRADVAYEFLDKLGGYVGTFKVGLELFLAEGPSFVRKFQQRLNGQAKLFLDLKLYDIPETMGRAAAVAGDLGVDYLTVHVDPGGKGLAEAVSRSTAKIFAVSVLTSLSIADLKNDQMADQDVAGAVVRRSRLAAQAGCAGVVCSVEESSLVRAEIADDRLIVCPGIRPTGTPIADQQRIATPEIAIKAGADLLVVGRPIRDAKDPVQATEKILQEIQTALANKS